MKIKQLLLYTSSLEEMKHFYGEVLGFPLEINEKERMAWEAGESWVEFKQASPGINPFYHIAFNIPSHKFKLAKEWMMKRVQLLTEDGKDEIYFDHLKAHSFYFQDPAGNIIECIGRSKHHHADHAFTIKDIYGVGEISLTVENAREACEKLISSGLRLRNLEIEEESLNFIGKDAAYLLVTPERRRWLFSHRNSRIYPISVRTDNGHTIKVNEYGNLQIRSLYPHTLL